MFFWNSLAFSMIQWMLAIWSLVPSFKFAGENEVRKSANVPESPRGLLGLRYQLGKTRVWCGNSRFFGVRHKIACGHQPDDSLNTLAYVISPTEKVTCRIFHLFQITYISQSFTNILSRANNRQHHSRCLKLQEHLLFHITRRSEDKTALG